MSVTYEAAMATLAAMFSGVDREVVALILQNNHGHMERTVENLLAMTGGGEEVPQAAPTPVSAVPAAQARRPPQAASAQPAAVPYPAQQRARPSYPQQQQQQQRQQPPAYNRRDSYEHKSVPHPSPAYRPSQPAPAPAPAPVNPAANDIYQLPDDFMRPPSYFRHIVGPSHAASAGSSASVPRARRASDAEQSQIDQDHLLAQMLQDEQFMRDLAENPERYADANSGASQPRARVVRATTTPSRAHPQLERRPSDPAPPAHVFAPASAALAAPLVRSSPSASRKSSTAASEPPLPVNEKLRALDASSSNPPPNKEQQQSSFKLKWDSLTSAAREKLARISERFKREQDHGPRGEYQELAAMSPHAHRSDDQHDLLPPAPAHNFEPPPDVITAEEAASLQASYNPPSHRLPIDDDSDEADPFGRGANGSDDEDEDEQIGALMRRQSEESKRAYTLKSPQQQQQQRRQEEDDGIVGLEAVSLHDVPLTSNELVAADRRNAQRQAQAAMADASGLGPAGAIDLVDPPSDDEQEHAKKRTARVPLLQDL